MQSVLDLNFQSGEEGGSYDLYYPLKIQVLMYSIKIMQSISERRGSLTDGEVCHNGGISCVHIQD